METRTVKPVGLLALAMAFALSLSACNTMEGVGEDIEQGGDAIKDEARENK